MLEAVTSALTTVISWVGSVVTALTSTDGALSALLPMLGIKAIKSFIWGA